METINVRSYLNKVLESRIEKNSNYSLRAFARHLDENPATLSQILSGKRPITDKRMRKFAKGLEMPFDEFLNECSEVSKHTSLTVEFFKVISDWYYDAILELTALNQFKPSVKWIAKVLRLDVNQTKMAIARLKDLELLDTRNELSWVDTSQKNIVAFDSDYSNIALKKYQKQILDKSKDSIDQFARGDREHNSFVLSMDSDLNDEVNQKIRKFQLELVNYIEEKSIKKNEVRVIHFGSFPLTQMEMNDEK